MNDPTTARIVVIILGLVAAVRLAGSIFLVATDHQAPDAPRRHSGVAVGRSPGCSRPAPPTSSSHHARHSARSYASSCFWWMNVTTPGVIRRKISFTLLTGMRIRICSYA